VTSGNARDPPGEPDRDEDQVRLTAWIHGRVQGVGFRWWTRARALELGLSGLAANLADGRVEVVAEGRRGDCNRLLELLRGGDAPGVVRLVVERFDPPRGLTRGFYES
jgi:acylphosphatase